MTAYRPLIYDASGKVIRRLPSGDTLDCLVTESALSLSDVTTGDASTSKHGLLPKIVQSLGTNGYVKLPGGLIIQWGTGSSTIDTEESFSFPASFSSACYGVIVSRTSAGTTPLTPVTEKSTTGFKIDRDDLINGTQTFFWLAIGV